jgi:crotonobetainyl-CoA:carnitine CoA-transferase CaiB-like acyl-CoA transferase
MSQTVLDTYAAPPKLGEHTNEVLIRLLGYSTDKMNALRREGVV